MSQISSEFQHLSVGVWGAGPCVWPKGCLILPSVTHHSTFCGTWSDQTRSGSHAHLRLLLGFVACGFFILSLSPSLTLTTNKYRPQVPLHACPLMLSSCFLLSAFWGPHSKVKWHLLSPGHSLSTPLPFSFAVSSVLWILICTQNLAGHHLYALTEGWFQHLHRHQNQRTFKYFT